jgi:hypothetical protein
MNKTVPATAFEEPRVRAVRNSFFAKGTLLNLSLKKYLTYPHGAANTEPAKIVWTKWSK